MDLTNKKLNVPESPIDPQATFLQELHRTAKKVEDILLTQANKGIFLTKLKTFTDLEDKFQSALKKAQEAAKANPDLRYGYDEVRDKGKDAPKPPRPGYEVERYYLLTNYPKAFWRPKLLFSPCGYLSKFYASFFLDSPHKDEPPNTETRLVCEYALLAVIYDFALNVDTCDRLCGTDEFWPEDVWQNLNFPLTLSDFNNLGMILSMIDTALKRVETDLDKLPVGTGQKTGGKAGGRKKPTKKLKPLSANAAAVYELLKTLPEHRGMKGREILNALEKQTPPIFIDQSTLTKNIIPELRHYKVKNKRGAGYYIGE